MADNTEFDLLIKLLNMMTSDNDNVALISARKANEQLAKLGFTWERLLKGRVTIVADPFGSSPMQEPPRAHRAPPQASPAPRPQPAPAPAPRPRPQPTQAPPRPQAPQPAQRQQPRQPYTAPPPQQPQNQWQTKVNQTAKQRRRNPMNIEDII